MCQITHFIVDQMKFKRRTISVSDLRWPAVWPAVIQGHVDSRHSRRQQTDRQYTPTETDTECGMWVLWAYKCTQTHTLYTHVCAHTQTHTHTHAYTPILPSMQASTHPHMQTHTNTHAPRYLWPLIVSGQCRPQQPGSWECCGAGQGSHCGNLLNIAYPEACYYPEKLSSFSPQNRPAQSI